MVMQAIAGFTFLLTLTVVTKADEPVELCTCEAYGNSYELYDKDQTIEFCGNCEYLISAHNTTNHHFEVWEQKEWINADYGTCRTKSIHIIIYFKDPYKGFGRHQIWIYVQERRVEVEGIPNGLLPCFLPELYVYLHCDEILRVHHGGGWVFVLDYNTGYYTISVPKFWPGTTNKTPFVGSGNMIGICGDCNRRLDDLVTSTGLDVLAIEDTVEHAYAAIAHSWARNPEDCETFGEGDFCLGNYEKIISAERYCYDFNPNNTDSNFEACLDAMTAKERALRFRACVKLMCNCETPEQRLIKICFFKRALEKWCLRDLNIAVRRWFTQNYCPPTCTDPHATYVDARSSCPNSCLNAFAEKQCTEPPEPGCECNEGFVVSNGECIPEDDCGCLLSNGTYLPVGDSYINEDCTIKFICVRPDPSRSPFIKEKPLDPCHHNGECRKIDGTRRCVCKDGFDGDGIEKCFKPVCIAQTENTYCASITKLYGVCHFHYDAPYIPHFTVWLNSDKVKAKVQLNDGTFQALTASQPWATLKGSVRIYLNKSGFVFVKTRLCQNCQKFILDKDAQSCPKVH